MNKISTEDPKWLDMLEVSKCGKILGIEKKRNEKKIEQRQSIRKLKSSLLNDGNASDNFPGTMHDSSSDQASKRSVSKHLMAKDSSLKSKLH